MRSIEKSREDLAQFVSKNRYEVMTEAVATLTDLIEPQGIKPIIVGGLAVEICTRGQYKLRTT